MRTWAALSAACLCCAAPAAAQQIPGLTLTGTLEQGAHIRGIAPPGTASLRFNDQIVPVAPDRRFIIGLDRDETAGVIEITYGDGRSARHAFAVAPHAWRLEHVNTPRRAPNADPTSASYQLREAEVLRMNAARAIRSNVDGWRQTFILPARGRFSGRFGSQRVYQGERASFHAGLDIAAGAGAPVVAPADGVVVLAPPPGFSLEGNLVIIDHGGGLSSAFLHLSRADVREGQRVRQGEAIGLVGATGRVTGPHLHWALVLNGTRIDPEPLVAP